MTMTTDDLLKHMAKHPEDYPLGSLHNILSQLPEHEAVKYAQLGASMDYLRTGGRDTPFKPKQDLRSAQPDITNKERNQLEQVYQRSSDEYTTHGLLQQMGTDADLPEDDSPPTLAEIVEASLEAHGGYEE